MGRNRFPHLQITPFQAEFAGAAYAGAGFPPQGSGPAEPVSSNDVEPYQAA
jgi:hypothetical protein